ncbi:MAG: glycosyltransferase [Candidatus Roizmanbacteria bacterium]|nr:glycosyltransferase [Candidatus Roizmanbacteria bacterium]
MAGKRNNLLLHNTIISIIIVTYNDEDIIENRLKAIAQVLKRLNTNFEIVVIDNNSSDATILKIRSLHRSIPQIRIIVLSKTYDSFTALSAGIDSCIGDYALLLNIYTDPPMIIPKCISILHNHIDIVIGQPTPPLTNRSLLARFAVRLLEKFSSHDILDPAMNLFALNRKAINAITRTRRKSRNLAYIHSVIGLRRARISYKPLTRYMHKLAKQTLISTILFHLDTIISNSYRPIRLVTYIGMLLSSLFLIYVFCIVILYFFNIRLAPQGWISVSAVMGTLFFLLFLLLSLLGEYIIRILNETRNEPFYFVSEELDKSVILSDDQKVNIV